MNKRLLQYVLRRTDNWPLYTVCKTVRTRSCYALLRTDNCPVNIFSDTVRTRCFYVLRRTDNCQNIYTVILLEQEAAMFSVEQTTALYLQGWEFAHLLIAYLLICSGAQITKIKWATVSHLLRLLRTNERLWANHSGHSWQMSNCEWLAQVAHDKWANEQNDSFIKRIAHLLCCSQKTSD